MVSSLDEFRPVYIVRALFLFFSVCRMDTLKVTALLIEQP
jgi:hypothetical protein